MRALPPINHCLNIASPTIEKAFSISGVSLSKLRATQYPTSVTEQGLNKEVRIVSYAFLFVEPLYIVRNTFIFTLDGLLFTPPHELLGFILSHQKTCRAPGLLQNAMSIIGSPSHSLRPFTQNTYHPCQNTLKLSKLLQNTLPNVRTLSHLPRTPPRRARTPTEPLGFF